MGASKKPCAHCGRPPGPGGPHAGDCPKHPGNRDSSLSQLGHGAMVYPGKGVFNGYDADGKPRMGNNPGVPFCREKAGGAGMKRDRKDVGQEFVKHFAHLGKPVAK